MGDSSEEESSKVLVKRESGADITLKVKAANEEDVSLNTKGDIPLRRVLLDYCDQKGLVYHAIQFTFDGGKIGEYQTPDDLGMDDDDIIDAWSAQMGGGLYEL